MRVKICGITNVEDAEAAVGMGAWAIGLIHHKESPRACDPAEAASISATFRRKCEVVGVFVNPSLGEVSRAVEDASLSMVQLSGEEGPAFCIEVARKTGAKVIKAVHVASAADVHAAEAYRTDFHLFDRRVGAARGGTGESFDWGLMRDHRSSVPSILAGGLDSDNVAEAITTARPEAVDVASGVESEPGRKDYGRLAGFFFQVAEAERELAAETPAAPGGREAS